MANFTYIAPCFIVADVKPAVAFYTEKLGFELRFIAPDDGPFFAIVGREDISVMLKAVAPEIKPIPNKTRHEWAPWDAYISVSDPASLFEEYSARSVEFRRPLKDDDDGLRGFEVMDADGYVLFFGRPRPTTPTLTKMSPQLLVADIERAIEFYRDQLAFSLEFRYEDFYAGIVKDGHSIHLKTGTPLRSEEDNLAITFSVGGIERLYESMLGQAIDIVQPLRQMPYGREFYIADPDGNRLAFLEEA